VWCATVLMTLASAVASAQSVGEPHAPQHSLAVSATFSEYFAPDSTDYLQPTVAVDRGRAHFEVRHNYEGLDTSSVWLGCNFDGGERVAWELVPIFGGVFGATSAVAPGYQASLTWRALNAYSESEYVIDAIDAESSFLYNWSELTVTPLSWLRAGLVVQRTRAYHTNRDIQRGLLIGVSHGRVELTADFFNVDESAPIIVVALRIGWER
jgi:hypothetical protein